MIDLEAEIRALRAQLARRDAEHEQELARLVDEKQRLIEEFKQDYDRLLASGAKTRAEQDRLSKELAEARSHIKRAKDPSPVQRPSWKRVIALARDACMTLERVKGGWQLTLGHMVRRFRFLKQIWELLVQEDWFLGDIFPPTREPQSPPVARPRLPFRAPVLARKLSFSTG